jgi:hypothetical protein
MRYLRLGSRSGHGTWEETNCDDYLSSTFSWGDSHGKPDFHLSRWTRMRLTQTLVCFLFLRAMALAGNPVPFINNPLVPMSVAPGSGTLTLTVNGGGFVSGSTVNWSGTPLATTFVSNTQLTASVPAADTLKAGSNLITVTNPGTGAASNVEQFLVAVPGTNVFYQSAPNSPYGNYLSPSGLWDFNGDGKLDILAFSWVPQYGGIMFASGTGTFAPAVPSNALVWGYWPSVVGDFNGDGKLDILGTNANTTVWPPSGTFQLFWGGGDGTFSAGPTVPIPSGFFVIGALASNFGAATTYDFNGDGNLDLLTLNVTANPPVIQILWGNGDGTFSVGPSTTLPGVFSVLAIADFNGDGTLDLLLGSGQSSATESGSFEVLLGKGDGTFYPAPGGPIDIGPAAYAVAVADLNGDGKLDLAIPDGVNGAPKAAGGLDTPPLAVLLGNGDGTFTRVQNCCGTPGQQAFNVVAADLNNDGKLDLAVSIANNVSDFAVSLKGAFPVYLETFLGKGDGTFQSTNYSLLLPSDTSLSGGDGTMGLYTADLNGDGKFDFVTGDIFGSGGPEFEISVLLQTPPPAQMPDFSISSANAMVAVKTGATATDNIQIASMNGFLSNNVALALSGCPVNATCSVAQPQGMIIPTSTGSFPVTIVTQACKTAAILPPSPFERWPTSVWFALTVFAAIVVLQMRRGERLSRIKQSSAWTVVILAGTAISSCGGTRAQQSPPCIGGTSAGSYTIGITATSDSITHSTGFTLVVRN